MRQGHDTGVYSTECACLWVRGMNGLLFGLELRDENYEFVMHLLYIKEFGTQ